MASKKNEDPKKKGAAAKKVAPARKTPAVKQAVPARKAMPAKKAAAATRGAIVTRAGPAKAAGSPRSKVTERGAKAKQDCCEALTRKVESLRKELRQTMQALQEATASRSRAVPRSLDANVLTSLQVLGLQQVSVSEGVVTFALPGVDVTLSDIEHGHGWLRLELRPGGTADQPLPLTPELLGILVALFQFLVDNAGYLSAAGICATCDDSNS